MAWQGQWEGSWQGNWAGGVDSNPNALYGTAAGTSSASATLTLSGETPVVDTPTGGAGGSSSRNKKRPSLVIVEVDGKEYKVPIEQLQEFLDAVAKERQETIEKPVVKAKKSVQKKVQEQPIAPPQITVKSIHSEDIALVQKHVDRTNEIMRQVWEGALKRYLEDIEEEEWLLMLL